MVVHGVGDTVRGQKVDGGGDADLVEDARFMYTTGPVECCDFAGEVDDGPGAADLLDAVELGGGGGYAEGERADDGAKRGVVEQEGVVPDELERV